MSVARSYIRGPRFALRSTDPAKVRACIACVYGNGDHAEWCEKRFNTSCTLDGISERVYPPPPEFTHEPITPANVEHDAHLFGEEAKCT